MAATKVSAIDIKRLWYAPTSSITAALTGATLKTLLASTDTKEVENVHQDTWSIEEDEASQDSYKNQLTGATYRMGARTMGDVTFNFTLGRYDFETKAAFMGGTGTETTWSRARGITDIHLCLIALTEDDVYCVLPYASISARESNTDGAVGVSVVGTMLEPENEAVMPEYWFAASEVA